MVSREVTFLPKLQGSPSITVGRFGAFGSQFLTTLPPLIPRWVEAIST